MTSSPFLATSMSAAPSVIPNITVKPTMSLTGESDEELSPSNLMDVSTIKPTQSGTFTVVRSYLSVQ